MKGGAGVIHQTKIGNFLMSSLRKPIHKQEPPFRKGGQGGFLPFLNITNPKANPKADR
jgi:hypothetical protein